MHLSGPSQFPFIVRNGHALLTRSLFRRTHFIQLLLLCCCMHFETTAPRNCSSFSAFRSPRHSPLPAIIIVSLFFFTAPPHTHTRPRSSCSSSSSSSAPLLYTQKCVKRSVAITLPAIHLAFRMDVSRDLDSVDVSAPLGY